MLNVVNFIKEHSDWEELLKSEPYSISIKRKDNLVMFNYSQGISQPSEIVNECRGLILDESDNFKVVRYGFYRFYNIDESSAANIDTHTMFATEKIDGSLVMIYYYDNCWHISTRSTFDADSGDCGTDFDNIIKTALKNENIDIEKFNKNWTYVFEVVSPESRVIIPYNETTIYFLMARDNNTLEEISIDLHESLKSIKRPKTYKFNTVNEFRKFVEQYNGIEFEGVVMQDAKYNRVKVKNPKWVELHIKHQNGKLTIKKVIEMLLSGELSEYVSYFPYEKDFIDSVVKEYTRIETRMIDLDNLNLSEQYPIKKDFAKSIDNISCMLKCNIKKGTLKSALFAAYDKKAHKWFKTLSANDYIKKFVED